MLNHESDGSGAIFATLAGSYNHQFRYCLGAAWSGMLQTLMPRILDLRDENLPWCMVYIKRLLLYKRPLTIQYMSLGPVKGLGLL